MLFDTHCHLDAAAFDGDRAAMLERAKDRGVGLFLCPGTNVMTSSAAVALSKAEPQVYAAVGIHPQEAAGATAEAFDALRHWLQAEPKVKAVGEIGLDYHWPEPSRDVQQAVFIEQVKLAASLDVPLIIHDREAHGDTLDILRRYGQGTRGVFHCYSGSLEMAEQLVKMGYYIGFTGSMVFANSRKLKKIVQALPEDRILIETDCPYLTPPPHRGERNEPAYVRYMAEEVARLRQLTPQEAARLTCENGKRLFSIP